MSPDVLHECEGVEQQDVVLVELKCRTMDLVQVDIRSDESVMVYAAADSIVHLLDLVFIESDLRKYLCEAIGKKLGSCGINGAAHAGEDAAE